MTVRCELFETLQSFGINSTFEYVTRKYDRHALLHTNPTFFGTIGTVRYLIEWTIPPRHNRSSPLTINTRITHYYRSLSELPLSKKEEELVHDLLNHYVKILDVDKKRKHVYVEVRNVVADMSVEDDDLGNNNCMEYYLMGKYEDCFLWNIGTDIPCLIDNPTRKIFRTIKDIFKRFHSKMTYYNISKELCHPISNN